ncbi:MAG: site-specific integrase, partial [Raoultibacter sp.]
MAAEQSVECDLGAAASVEAFCESLRIEHNASPHTVRAYCVDLQDFI